MKAIIGGLVTGFAAYWVVKWIRNREPTRSDVARAFPLPTSGVDGLGDEAGVYGTLYDIRDKLEKATQLYKDATSKAEGLEMDLIKANDEFSSAEADRRPTILFRIAEIQRQRDLSVLEAELVIRNIINPLREKLITESARLMSAVVAPNIALNRSGRIPSF